MLAVFSSRLPVGSSASTSLGRLASARATATRCCSPPDSFAGRCSKRWLSPKVDSKVVARSRASSGPKPIINCGSITFSSASKSGSRWWNWYTNPSFSRRITVQRSGPRLCVSSPSILIEPSKPPSSSPSACNNVDLPVPLGPNNATISPSAIAKLTPHRTSMVTSPCVNTRRTSVISAIILLITKHLHRVGSGSFERRI